MKTIFAFFLLISSVAMVQPGQAQPGQVANYSTGKPGTDGYEEFSFWVRNNTVSNISYVYGRDRKEAKINYLGKSSLNGKPAFKLGLPNGVTLYAVPLDITLMITDRPGKYVKRFSWQYEGPVNGIGTFCQPCAPDERSAMRLIKGYYL
jgi:hypothetical protein